MSYERGETMKKKKFILNTAMLTGSSLLMSFIGMAYQVWLVGRIGAAGIGLYQLVMAVESLAVTVAVSGIRFAVTRLVAEELGWAGARACAAPC
jgi:stage V sporulation protein B